MGAGWMLFGQEGHGVAVPSGFVAHTEAERYASIAKVGTATFILTVQCGKEKRSEIQLTKGDPGTNRVTVTGDVDQRRRNGKPNNMTGRMRESLESHAK